MVVENIGLPPWEREEYVAIREAMRDFATNEIRPHVKWMEEHEEVPKKLRDQMGALGFYGVPFDEKYGGLGLGKIGSCVIAEELGAAHPSTGVVFGAHVGLGLEAVNLFGNEDQKIRYLVPGITGEKFGALATTEPSIGSDVGGMKTRAVKVDGGWTLSGEKQFITNGEIADFVIIFAQTDPKGHNKTLAAFIVDTNSKGFSVAKREKKIGIHASNTNSLVLDNVFVPDVNLLGNPGDGFKMVMRIFNNSRITLTASCVGFVARAIEEAAGYAKNRILFGTPMLMLQNTQLKLAEMEAIRRVIQSAVMCAAWKVDRGEDVRVDAAVVKYLGPELASKAVDMGLQLHGGSGFIEEFPIAMLYRDIRVFRLFEGTSEVQLLTIAKDLAKQFMK